MDELLMAPPEVLMGEAGLCGFWAMVAVREIVRATGPPRARFRCRVGGLAFYRKYGTAPVLI